MKTLAFVMLLSAAFLASCAIETPESSENAGDTMASGDIHRMDTNSASRRTPADRSATAERTTPPGADTSSSPEGSTLSLYPVDEADQDPSFFAFRLRLLDAVVRRDVEALFESIAEDVRISFGPGGGHEDFRTHWDPENPQSELWTTLGRVIGGGGTFLESGLAGDDVSATFQAPYYYAEFPGERFDAFQTGVVIGDAVAVRTEPERDAQIVDTLDFTLVGIRDFEGVERGGARWIRVTLSGDRHGYVPEANIASPIGYRAIFQKRNGHWLMTAFVAGD